MALYILTGDGVVGYIAVDLYWGRCGRKLDERSLLGTERQGMVSLDDAEEIDTVYLCWGRSGRVWRCISLLETVW